MDFKENRFKKIINFLEQLIVILAPYFLIRKGVSGTRYFLYASFIIILLGIFLGKRKFTLKNKWIFIFGYLFTIYYGGMLWHYGKTYEAHKYLFNFALHFTVLLLFSQIKIKEWAFKYAGGVTIASIWLPMVSAFREWQELGYRAARLSGDWNLNLFGGILGVSVLVTFYLLLNDKIRWFYKIPIGITHYASIFFLLMGQSRISWVVVSVVSIVIIVFSSKKSCGGYLIVLILLFCGIFLSNNSLFSRYYNRALSIGDTKNNSSNVIRLLMWEEARSQIKKGFWFGNGVGGYTDKARENHPEYKRYLLEGGKILSRRNGPEKNMWTYSVSIPYNGEIDGKISRRVEGDLAAEVDGKVDVDLKGESIGKSDGRVDAHLKGEFKSNDIHSTFDKVINKGISGEFKGETDGHFKGVFDGWYKGEIKGHINGRVKGKFNGIYFAHLSLPFDDFVKFEAYTQVEHSHNLFLELMVVSGIFGLIFFVTAYGLLFVEVVKGVILYKNYPRNMAVYALLIFTIYGGYNLTDTGFYFTRLNLSVMLISGLALAYIKGEEEKKKRK